MHYCHFLEEIEVLNLILHWCITLSKSFLLMHYSIVLIPCTYWNIEKKHYVFNISEPILLVGIGWFDTAIEFVIPSCINCTNPDRFHHMLEKLTVSSQHSAAWRSAYPHNASVLDEGIVFHPSGWPFVCHQPSCHSKKRSTHIISSCKSSTSSVNRIAHALDLHHSTHSASHSSSFSSIPTTPKVFQIQDNRLLPSDSPSSTSDISHTSELPSGCSLLCQLTFPRSNPSDSSAVCAAQYVSTFASIWAWTVARVLQARVLAVWPLTNWSLKRNKYEQICKLFRSWSKDSYACATWRRHSISVSRLSNVILVPICDGSQRGILYTGRERESLDVCYAEWRRTVCITAAWLSRHWSCRKVYYCATESWFIDDLGHGARSCLPRPSSHV
jgi:hypothetical protein